MSAQNTNLTVEELREQIRTVREHIVELVARMDHIKLQVLSQIRADYALKIGCWEQALLEAEIAARRSRRRLALAQAQANRGELLQMDEIEEQLDEELAEWITKAERARLAYEHALARITGSVTLGPADEKELKRLYRVLVKRVHPDVSHNADDDSLLLFKLAQAAYSNGDIGTLRSLEVATRHLDSSQDDLAAISDKALFEQELELVGIEAGVIEERLNELENCEEMRLGTLLNNSEWVCARTDELRQAVEQWEHDRDECDRKLADLKERCDGR